jgi:hypothetical protein
MQKESILLICLAVSTILPSCNRNTDQLPPKKAPPVQLTMAATVNGLTPVDFIFSQTKTATSDTVWLSIRNNSSVAITSLTYVVELCNVLPQNYDNCNMQVQGQLTVPLAAGAILSKVYTWTNKGIKLDSNLINTGVISYSGLTAHPFANIYNNTYTIFESSAHAIGYYGSVRGYILADGTARFRIKGKGTDQFNATGLFTPLTPPQANSFDGLLKNGDNILAPFKLDTIEVGGNKLLLDNVDRNFHFRLQLKSPIQDTIQSIQVFTQRNF